MKHFIIIVSFLLAPINVLGNPTVVSRSDESNLMNLDLRLSAMGDIGLVIEDIANQINFYDFGGLSAGVMDDNGAMSNLLVPAILGFDMTEDEFEQNEWYMGKLLIRGVQKIDEYNVVGGAVNIYSSKNQYYDPAYMSITKLFKIFFYDSLILAHRFGRYFTGGIRGGYIIKNIKITNPFRLDDYSEKIIYGEPSLIFQPKSNLWTFGVGYQWEKHKNAADNYTDDFLFHTIKLPVIYNDTKMNLGIMFSYQIVNSFQNSVNYDGGLFKIQTRRKIKFNEKYLMIGSGLKYTSGYHFYSLDFWRYTEADKTLEFGVGIAYLNLLGIEYQHKVYNKDGVNEHFNQINQGCEIYFIEHHPLRFGYSFGFAAPKYSYYFNELESIISAGFGIYPIDSKMRIDISARLRFYKTDDWWHTEPYIGISFYLTDRVDYLR